MARHSSGWVLGLILAVALAARLAAGAWWQAQLPPGARFGFGDSEGYWQLGQAIEKGQPYEYGAVAARVFRTPGYPLLLALLFKCAGPSVAAARALSAVLATFAVGGVYWLGQRLFDRRTGLVAAAIAGLYPGAVAMGGLVLSEAPFCALMMLQFALWVQGWKSAHSGRFNGWLLAAGLAAGGATLVRPSWLLFTPFAALCALLADGPWRQCLRQAVPLLAGLCLAMLPWWVRNERVVGHFVPTTLEVGASLYDGLNPAATGASNMDPVQARQAFWRQSAAIDPLPARAPLELRVDRALRSEALRWAYSHPGQTLRLAGRKLVRTWNIWPNDENLRSGPLRALIMVSYTPLLGLGLLGAWRYGRRGWPYVLCLLPTVYFALLHSVFVGSIRYREPAMLLLTVLAAAVLVEGRASRATGQGSTA